MNNYPEYVVVNGKRYDINTDFRVAIECDKISNDVNIGDYERALAIIYKLFGDKGLEDYEAHEELLKLGKLFLSCGKEIKQSNEEPDMDYIYDMPLIEASFMSDFRIWLPDISMHWWQFTNLINGLSNSEFGNSCILNKVRAGRRYDASKIKDQKERKEFIEWQKSVALPKKQKHTKKQQDNANEIFKKLGLRKE